MRRCIEYGVRVIEHGTLLDDATARSVANKGAFVIPTLVIIHVLAKQGRMRSLPEASVGKVHVIVRKTKEGLGKL